MPERLLDTLFNEIEIPEQLTTRSHFGHKLVMRPGVHELIDDDGLTWSCDHIEGV